MILGLVSNCWRWHLAAGVPLESLIAEASRRGYGVVELRQGCLGTHESGDPKLPIAERLAELAARFPKLRFNIAMSAAFLCCGCSVDHPVFTAGRDAAQAIANGRAPHLRLVDLITIREQIASGRIDVIAESLANLARGMIEVGGTLSVEHSREPWTFFRSVFQAAGAKLGPDAPRLKICYDPVNLLAPEDGIEPAAATAALRGDEISMVHFKQRRDGKPLPVVADGEIDWAGQIDLLQKMPFHGPGLFEVESHKRLWDNLAESVRYLRARGLKVENIP